MTTVEDAVDTVVIVTTTGVIEEVGGTTTVEAEEDTVVIVTTVITGVALGLAVALLDTVAAAPLATAAEAVLAALDTVEGTTMIAVTLIVDLDLGTMTGDMNALSVDMGMGGRLGRFVEKKAYDVWKLAGD
jgi:hypothetical protein